MDRTIRVTGKGKLSVAPDLIRLQLNLEDRKKKYEDALKASAEQTELLREALFPLGFEGKQLKTVFFNVDTEYESYETKEHIWKNRLAGYRFHHNLKLEFALDHERLGKVLYALGQSKVQPEIHLSYAVADPEKSRNELLACAVADAKTKAEVLAKAAGVKLGAIAGIEYSFGTADFAVRPVNRLMAPKAMASGMDSYSISMEPEEIKAEDDVTVLWEIAK